MRTLVRESGSTPCTPRPADFWSFFSHAGPTPSPRPFYAARAEHGGRTDTSASQGTTLHVPAVRRAVCPHRLWTRLRTGMRESGFTPCGARLARFWTKFRQPPGDSGMVPFLVAASSLVAACPCCATAVGRIGSPAATTPVHRHCGQRCGQTPENRVSRLVRQGLQDFGYFFAMLCRGNGTRSAQAASVATSPPAMPTDRERALSTPTVDKAADSRPRIGFHALRDKAFAKLDKDSPMIGRRIRPRPHRESERTSPRRRRR